MLTGTIRSFPSRCYAHEALIQWSALFFSPDFKEIDNLNFKLALLQGSLDFVDNDKWLPDFTKRS